MQNYGKSYFFLKSYCIGHLNSRLFYCNELRLYSILIQARKEETVKIAIPLENIKSNIQLFMLYYYLKDLVGIDTAKTLSSPYTKLLSHIATHAVLVPCFRRKLDLGMVIFVVLGWEGKVEPQSRGVCLPLSSRANFHWTKLSLYFAQSCTETSLVWGNGEVEKKTQTLSSNFWCVLLQNHWRPYQCLDVVA